MTHALLEAVKINGRLGTIAKIESGPGYERYGVEFRPVDENYRGFFGKAVFRPDQIARV